MSTTSGTPQTYRPLRGTEDQELVTGEAVLLDIPAASLPQRLASGLIDLIVGYVGLIASVWGISAIGPSISSANAETLTLLIMVVWFVGLPVAVETFTRGRTLGKLALGLRTVRDDGGPIVFRHALARGLVGFVEIYALLGIPALLAGMSTARARRIGDLAAGTYVVREANNISLGPPTGMPYALAGWAQRADIASLPDGVALSIRQLLERRHSLSPQARAAVAHDLLARVLPLVSPPPPAAAHPEDVLAAVLAERRRRDEQRLRTDEETRRRLLPADRL